MCTTISLSYIASPMTIPMAMAAILVPVALTWPMLMTLNENAYDFDCL